MPRSLSGLKGSIRQSIQAFSVQIMERTVTLASESTNTPSIVLIFSARAFWVQSRWTTWNRLHGRAKHL